MAQIVTPFTHDDMRNWLEHYSGAKIVAEICQKGGHGSRRFVADAPRYRSFGEITMIDPEWAGDTDRFDRKKYQHYRMDAVLSILPARDSINQGDCLTVGIELKGSESDLVAENELQQYLLWFDYTFVAVPSALVDTAIKKLEMEGLTNTVGLLDVQKGAVIEMAERHKVDPVRAYRVLQRIQINYLFGDCGGKVITVSNSGPDESASSETISDTPASKESTTPIDAATAAERAAKRKQRMESVAAAAEMLPDVIRTRLCTVSPKAQQAYHCISTSPGVRADGIEKDLESSEPATRRYLAELITAGLIAHRGSKKKGGYFPSHDTRQIANMAKCRTCIVMQQLGLELPETEQEADPVK